MNVNTVVGARSPAGAVKSGAVAVRNIQNWRGGARKSVAG